MAYGTPGTHGKARSDGILLSQSPIHFTARAWSDAEDEKAKGEAQGSMFKARPRPRCLGIRCSRFSQSYSSSYSYSSSRWIVDALVRFSDFPFQLSAFRVRAHSSPFGFPFALKGLPHRSQRRKRRSEFQVSAFRFQLSGFSFPISAFPFQLSDFSFPVRAHSAFHSRGNPASEVHRRAWNDAEDSIKSLAVCRLGHSISLRPTF